MKFSANDPSAPAAAGPLKRRGLLAGAGAAGAAVLAAKALPGASVATAPVATTTAAAAPAGGYQTTQHVLRYYQTAKV